MQFQLTPANLKKIIDSIDTKYDKNVLKAIIFASRSCREVQSLGIRADRAVNFLEKTISAAEEWQSALIAANDMMHLHLRERKERIEERVNLIDKKITQLGDLLPKSREDDLLSEKDQLADRLDRITEMQNKQVKVSIKHLQQGKKRLAIGLFEENRIKRQKISSGAPRALDNEDEEFIVKTIEDKSKAYGRRHDTILYANHRVKKKKFLSIVNHNLFRRGKKLIKGATTVLNRARPRNKASKAVKLHIGKWLFCAKKPPKTEQEANECTYH